MGFKDDTVRKTIRKEINEFSIAIRNAFDIWKANNKSITSDSSYCDIL